MIAIDVPMPNCCDECFALDDCGDYPYCLISHDQRGYNFNTREKQMPTCPLIEVDSPNFDGTLLNLDDYVRVGDIMDCLSEVFSSNEDLIHVEGLIEWAMGKRAVSKKELWDSLERQFEEDEILDE